MTGSQVHEVALNMTGEGMRNWLSKALKTLSDNLAECLHRDAVRGYERRLGRIRMPETTHELFEWFLNLDRSHQGRLSVIDCGILPDNPAHSENSVPADRLPSPRVFPSYILFSYVGHRV
jgi:hypothetical protein